MDYIDEHMWDDNVLRSSLQQWRYLLGQWKKNLSNDVRSIADVAHIPLGESKAYSKGTIHEGTNLPLAGTANNNTWAILRGHVSQRASDHDLASAPSSNDVVKTPFHAGFEIIVEEVKVLNRRAESTFQAIMATMAIVESQKAIAQAETISKLTNLAFFFIPLTLTASIFGMNITVHRHASLPLHLAIDTNAMGRHGRIN